MNPNVKLALSRLADIKDAGYKIGIINHHKQHYSFDSEYFDNRIRDYLLAYKDGQEPIISIIVWNGPKHIISIRADKKYTTQPPTALTKQISVWDNTEEFGSSTNKLSRKLNYTLLNHNQWIQHVQTQTVKCDCEHFPYDVDMIDVKRPPYDA